jgi:two-component system nitrate/nitrite response regulator NarL
MLAVIDIAAVEDNVLFAQGLRALVDGVDGMRMTTVVRSVDELLRIPDPIDVVLLDPVLRGQSDPALNVRRLVEAGHRVLVVDGSREPSTVAATLAAGAHGYLTREHDLAGLAATVRAIATGATAWSAGPTCAATPAAAPRRPPLSRQEHLVLMAYASGLTLESAARHLGISPATAHTYLRRVKAKYERAGIQVSTKLELAEQVRADCVAGPYPPA